MLCILVWIITICWCLTSGQINHCLRPVGCHKDECCFNIVPMTGPICDAIPGCASPFKPDCCRNSRPVHTKYGIMYGYAISLDTEYGYSDRAKRYVQVWRGIPYAQAPTRENNLRFRRPVKPLESNVKYDATYYRASCAQPHLTGPMIDSFKSWSKYSWAWSKRLPVVQTKDEFEKISEDCLYLNIYSLNETREFGNKKYPILVIFDAFDHLTGTANRYPGHALAQLGLIVVKVNFRLGPFGYLAMGNSITSGPLNDDVKLGNFALWDQLMALEFIRDHAHLFQGDPNKITVMGHGSAAGDVALHIISYKSGRRKPPMFHQAILMSGSDQAEGGFVQNKDESMAYAKQLAFQIGCNSDSWYQILSCLKFRTWEELANIGAQVRIHRPDWKTRPWAPMFDKDFVDQMPDKLWTTRQFEHIPIIGGMNVDDGAFHALSSLYNSNNVSNWNIVSEKYQTNTTGQLFVPDKKFDGLSRDQMWTGFYEMAKNDFATNPEGVANSLQFEYTYWPDPTSKSACWTLYRQAWTDRLIGSGLVKTLRAHSTLNIQPDRVTYANRTQMYISAYSSSSDVWSRVLGSYFGSHLVYVYGLPRLAQWVNWSQLQHDWTDNLGLHPPPSPFAKLDLNITDYWLSFVSNFVKSQNATPEPVRNLTWDTYRPNNRTFLWLNLTANYTQSTSHQGYSIDMLGTDGGFDLKQNYRVIQHAYWNYLYANHLKWYPRVRWPAPEPNYEQVHQTISMFLTGIVVIVVIIILTLIIIYHRRRKFMSKF